MSLTKSELQAIKKIIKNETSPLNKKLKSNRNDIVDDIIEYLDKNFMTKDEFQEIKNMISHLPNKDEYYEKMDELMKEVKASREENSIHTAQVKRLADRVERHHPTN